MSYSCLFLIYCNPLCHKTEQYLGLSDLHFPTKDLGFLCWNPPWCHGSFLQPNPTNRVRPDHKQPLRVSQIGIVCSAKNVKNHETSSKNLWGHGHFACWQHLPGPSKQVVWIVHSLLSSSSANGTNLFLVTSMPWFLAQFWVRTSMRDPDAWRKYHHSHARGEEIKLTGCHLFRRLFLPKRPAQRHGIQVLCHSWILPT